MPYLYFEVDVVRWIKERYRKQWKTPYNLSAYACQQLNEAVIMIIAKPKFLANDELDIARIQKCIVHILESNSTNEILFHLKVLFLKTPKWDNKSNYYRVLSQLLLPLALSKIQPLVVDSEKYSGHGIAIRMLEMLINPPGHYKNFNIVFILRELSAKSKTLPATMPSFRSRYFFQLCGKNPDRYQLFLQQSKSSCQNSSKDTQDQIQSTFNIAARIT